MPPSYTLHKSFLSRHSTFFREVLVTPNENGPIVVTDTEPTVFGLFASFIYNGCCSNIEDHVAVKARDPSLLSLRAWLFTMRISATDFANYIVQHLQKKASERHSASH
ncbi:hypothetical protein CC78DRAFT_568804 [Lojkania enalia]|uniref:BTB domain-containing protein n=1 Tax=Lojkania enalia TaxID=147567 RepID=A0A9P4N5S8_9PLEO|nr:hypothetical protein CC78DRAFT_568804 [Didymosphaeria enalia]